MKTNGKFRGDLDKLHSEIKKGGKEPPCPFCGLPRVQRSDYVRCCVCGINWLEGEPLDQDPRTVRLNKFLEEAKALGFRKEKK